MITLAIDTSDRHFTLAVLNNDLVVNEFDSRTSVVTNRIKTDLQTNQLAATSATLFPALQSVLSASDYKLSNLDLIAVAVGPGSFTGLRIGVVAAKTLAYANQTPIIGVNTLEVIAGQAVDWVYTSESMDNRIGCESVSGISVRSVINAQRQQLFASQHRFAPSNESTGGNLVMRELAANQLLDHQEFLDLLGAGDIITGPGLSLLTEKIRQLPLVIERQVLVVDRDSWSCSAVGVGQLGRGRFLAGEVDDCWSLQPFYFRPSYAEEN